MVIPVFLPGEQDKKRMLWACRLKMLGLEPWGVLGLDLGGGY